jgi:hypothetical protein
MRFQSLGGWRALWLAATVCGVGSLGGLAVLRARRPAPAAGRAGPCPASPAPRIAGTLPPGATRTWPVCVPHAARARLRLDARGGGDLDCYLYGPGRALVARDDEDANACTLAWRPAGPGAYSLQLVNAGTSPSDYAARTGDLPPTALPPRPR